MFELGKQIVRERRCINGITHASSCSCDAFPAGKEVACSIVSSPAHAIQVGWHYRWLHDGLQQAAHNTTVITCAAPPTPSLHVTTCLSPCPAAPVLFVLPRKDWSLFMPLMDIV